MFKNILKSIENKKDVINKNSIYLINGKFLLDNSLGYAYLDNVYNRDLISRYFKNDPLKRHNLKTTVLNKVFLSNGMYITNSHNNEAPNFKGSLYRFSRGNHNDKVFDLHNNKVLHIFLDKQGYENKLDDYKIFSKYFRIPKILWSDGKSLLIEDFINYSSSWTKTDLCSIIDDIFQCYLQFFMEYSNKNEYKLLKVRELIDKIEYCNYKKLFQKNISRELLEFEFPILKIHGDLRRANILLERDTKKIYYIDWELSEQFIFFYDFFFLMYHEAIYSSNYFIIENYFKGCYDNYLFKMFTLFGLEYKETYKLEYLNIFLLESFIKRRKSKDVIRKKYRNYKKLINKYRKYQLV